MRQESSLINDRNQPRSVAVYVVTNHVNLRDSLSAGYVGPLNSYYRSYTADFLELCPGWIPLFSGIITQDMLDLVQRSHPATTIPVVLELSFTREELHDIPTWSQRSGENGETRWCYAYNQVIGFDRLKAIHFLSEEEFTEFRVRVFRDMPDYAKLMRCTPSLLQQNGPAIGDISDWLRTLPVQSSPDKASFMAHDRVSGAFLLAFPFTPSNLIGELLDLVVRFPRPEAQLLPWLAKGLYPENQSFSTATNENELLFAACVQVLHESESTVITGQPLLDRIEAKLTSQNIDASSSLEILRKARRYLRNEELFGPLKNSRLVVAAALLLFLMRPEAERLMNWSQEETGATEEVMQTAMIFAGLLRGRKALDTKLRPVKYDKEAVKFIVWSLNKEAMKEAEGYKSADPGSAGNVTEKKSEVPADEGVSQAELLQEHKEAEQQLSSPDQREYELFNSVNSKDAASAAPRTQAAKRKGSTKKTASAGQTRSESEELRDLLMAAEYSDPGVRAAALALCLKMSWNNCVISQVVIPLDENSTLAPVMRGRSKVLTLTMPGIAIVEHELLDVRFRECLLAVRPNDRKWLQAAAETDMDSLRSVKNHEAVLAAEEAPEF